LAQESEKEHVMSVWDDLVKMGDDLAKAGGDLLSGNVNAAAGDLGAAVSDAGNAATDTPALLQVLPNEIWSSLVDAGYGFRDILGNFFSPRGPEGPLHPIGNNGSDAPGLHHFDVRDAIANIDTLLKGADGSHSANGDKGWQAGWRWGHNPDLSPTRLTEDNPAVKAGEELKDAYLRNHPPHLGEPINPHEKVSGPNIDQGPAGVSSDDHKTAQSVDADQSGHGIVSVLGGSAPHNDLAAVIHAANNPQQLLPQVAAAAHDLQAAALAHNALPVGESSTEYHDANSGAAHDAFAALIHAANYPEQLSPQVTEGEHDLQLAAHPHDAGGGSSGGAWSDIMPPLPSAHPVETVPAQLPAALSEAHHISLPILEPFHHLH